MCNRHGRESLVVGETVEVIQRKKSYRTLCLIIKRVNVF